MLGGRVYQAARLLAILCLGLLGSRLQQSVHAQTTADEYQIKAAFIFHFAQFAEWPAGALDSASSNLNFCLFDDEPRRQQLQGIIEGKQVGARVLHFRLIHPPQETQGCNILFLSRDQVSRQAATLRSLRGEPVLTVGESASFLNDGGMIRFHLDDGKIRFDINLRAADTAHLKISSRLLLLATVVIRDDGTEQGR